MHYQLHSCTGLANDVWVELKIISHWPLRFLPSLPPTLCPPLSTPFYSMIAHRPIGGSLNWRSASVIGFLSRSSLNKGCTQRQRQPGRHYRVLACNKWAPSFVHAGKIATASIMQRPHTQRLTHTHTLLHAVCRFFFFFSNNDSKFV